VASHVTAETIAIGRTAPTLVRGLGTWDVSFLTFSSIVGSAIFIAAAIVPREMPQPTVMMGLWALAGLLTLAGAATYAELATMYPEAGGQYHYLKAAYGPLYGFLFGWTSFLVIQTGAIAYLAVASADRLGVFVPFFKASHSLFVVPLGVTSVTVNGSQVGAAIAIAILSAINYFGLREGAGVQNAITLIKIGALVALIVLGFAAPAKVEPQWTALPHDIDWVPAIGLAMIGVLWCFDGWYLSTYCGGEVRDPARNLPRGMIMGVLLSTVLLIAVNFVYLRALPVEQLGQADGIGEAAVSALFGARWTWLMTMAVFVSIVGCLAACVLAGSRVYLPMAQDGLFFRSFARIHPAYRTPSACIVAQAAWSIVLAFSGTYEQLGTYTLFAVFMFHAATGVAVIVLRRTEPDRPRPYRTWGYPWTPILFILTALGFVVSTLIERPVESMWGLLLVLLGVPAYLWWSRQAADRRP
jgi:APA family basic amino acid/polyamine antiporter